MTKLTTDLYWDCDCMDDYIHHRSIKYCPECKARRDDQPSARRDEVIAKYGLSESRLEVLEQKADIERTKIKNRIVHLAVAIGAIDAQYKSIQMAGQAMNSEAVHPYLDKLQMSRDHLAQVRDDLYKLLD